MAVRLIDEAHNMLTAYAIYALWVIIGLATAYHAIEKNPHLASGHVWTIVLLTWPLVWIRALWELRR